MEQPPNSDTDATPAETPAENPASAPHAAPRRWFLSAVLGIALIVALTPVAFTATPRRCASCHEMKPYYDSWESSSHRAAVRSCLGCHVKPGALDVVGFELGFPRMVAAHVAGTPVRSSAANAPPVESCLRGGCHSLNREVSNSADLKISHRVHVAEQHIGCPTCHAGAVHAGVDGRLKLPPMKLCKRCHADKMTDCSYCHIQKHLKAQPGAH